MVDVTVIINNRDLLEWPRKMCADIERMHGLREIIILDNGTTNRAVLQWYKDCPHKVIFLENLGHTAPWDSGVIDLIDTDLYVVSDPDLDLGGVPADTLVHLANILRAFPALGKVGLSLESRGIPMDSPYFEHVNNYEKLMLERGVIQNLFVNAPVDTTFAIYDRRFLNRYEICGVRALAPYVARHIPWHIVEPDAEFRYYLDHANSSSTYKTFVQHEPEGLLSKLYREHETGKVSSKWSSYFPIYERWFGPYRQKPVKLLEIGVQNGGSLEIWSKYFPQGALFVGCDVNPAVANLRYSDPRIKVVVGMASERRTLEAVSGQGQDRFDLIIDDGSHQSLDTISNFINYFPLLAPGGVYVVEDMHCAYWPEYGGGFFNHRSAASFFKAMFDLLNIEHCRGDFDAGKLFQTFFGNEAAPTLLSDGTIASISVYNSVYIIEKSTTAFKPLCGETVIVGDDSTIEPRVFRAGKA